jgi:hypothetical protein
VGTLSRSQPGAGAPNTISTLETSAPDSEKSGPRLDQGVLIKTIEGIQHTLLSLTQGIEKMVN